MRKTILQYLKKCPLALVVFVAFYFCACAKPIQAQLTSNKEKYDRNDTLRGSLNNYRNWWDVNKYEITVKPNFESETIEGETIIRFKITGKIGDSMQIDLQQPLIVDEISLAGNPSPFVRHNQVIMIPTKDWLFTAGNLFQLKIKYHGKPTKANRPPWDGGWIWKKDKQGRPWMSVACQGLGASVWYPCKDHQSDEPDQGASLTIIVPEGLTAVGNGRLSSTSTQHGLSTFRWDILNPINSYNIVPYIGHYTSFKNKYQGEAGVLDCEYWVLDYNLEKAQNQFQQVKPMLECFENWFGPYPFYADGYKLVEAPHLGMEHQSAVAYGNNFMNGYLGRDLSGTGWGTKWDFILIHESGHEWFGNNITTKDIADMWVHEGFTNYSETLYTECQFGKEAGSEYLIGIRKNIENDKPIIGTYGVNEEGSGDMYYKGANIIHTIRTMMQDDAKFKDMLRGMNKEYYHKTVTTKEIEDYIANFTGFGSKLQAFFDVYLRTVEVPKLNWQVKNGKLKYRLSSSNKNLTMYIYIPTAKGKGAWKWIKANQTATETVSASESDMELLWNNNLYINYTGTNDL